MIISAKVVGSNVPFEVYSKQADGVSRGHKDMILSRGDIMNFSTNPKRWLDGYRIESEDTAATAWGSLIETLAGLSGDFADKYSVAPEVYPDKKTGEKKPWNWNSTFCKDWRDAQGEKEVVKSDVMEKAEKAVAALEDDDDVSDLFSLAQKQVMVVGIWKDKDTGIEVPLRCLIDIVPGLLSARFKKALADFKTARNGNPDMWARVVDDSGYDIQAALSLDLYTKATGEDRTDWIWPVQENVPPYHVVKPMPAATQEFIAYGRAKYESALRSYAACLTTGTWPSYSTGSRLVFGACQYIGPESVWSYREHGGMPPDRHDYQPQPKSDGAALDGIPWTPGV